MSEELVVLINEKNRVLGTAPKKTIHTDRTPLHRGFSTFIFNGEKKLLLQQRSHIKKTWPLVWSNSCCGHPAFGERITTAARRRLKFELGINRVTLVMVEKNYRYTCEKDGVVENEICPILVGKTTDIPIINCDEVEAIRWVAWETFGEVIKKERGHFSPWCIEEHAILNQSAVFQKFYCSL